MSFFLFTGLKTSSFAAGHLDGLWLFQSVRKNGNSSHLPEGDVLTLTIRGSSGEFKMTPGNPGVVESLIKQFCTTIHGSGRITYLPSPSKNPKSATKNSIGAENDEIRRAKFDILEVRGENRQSYCPATQILGQLTNREIANQLEHHALKIDFQHNQVGNILNVMAFHQKDVIELTFKKQNILH